MEVVALHVGGGDVLRHFVLGYLTGRDQVVAHAELVGDLQERVVEHVADDHHDDVVARFDEVGERADERDAVALERDDVTDREDHRAVADAELLARRGAVVIDEAFGIDADRRCA